MNYINEFDPFAAEWLRSLIDAGHLPPVVVDERSILEVKADEVRGYRQCHWFGGIGGWPLAFRLAGWGPDEPVWTGSCPCQPYSSAGKGEGDEDPRNLWPEMFRLVRECRPQRIFGEQVPNAIGHGWLDRVSADLESEGYAVGSVVLGAHGVSAPHVRHRIFWAADIRLDDAPGERIRLPAETVPRRDGADDGIPGTAGPGLRLGLDDADGDRLAGREERDGEPETGLETPRGADALRPGVRTGGVGVPDLPREAAVAGVPEGPGVERHGGPGFWDAYDLVHCRDDKFRRVESGTFPLVNGIPRKTRPLVARLAELGVAPKVARRVVDLAKRNRVGRLRGYGNSVVPQVAALFIRAYMEARGIA